MRLIPVFTAFAVLVTASRLGAQDPQEGPSSKPADTKAPGPAKPPAKSNKDSATKNAPDQPRWDPLRAEKDIEVGSTTCTRAISMRPSTAFRTPSRPSPATLFPSGIS